jgi:glutathione S-transferase
MITLYHAPRSRSSGMVWLLEELGVPYEIETVPIVYGNGQGAPAPESYRAIHPHKKVPALDDSGVIVFECSGVAQYLCDAYPANGLAPPIGDPMRGKYDTLLAYWAGPMNAIATARFRGWDKEGPTGFGTFDDMEKFMETTVAAADPWILGKRFTAADVLFGGAVDFFTGAGLLSKRDAFESYSKRLNDRPARKRALEKDNG